ncbi:MAG: tetratricopeptide repeat protein [Planctomycetota bacterium]
MDGPYPRFFDAAYVKGLDFDDDGRAAAMVDVDGDGDLDLALQSLQGLRIMENTSAPRHFCRVALEATKGNAMALGAIVRVTAGGVKQQDWMKLTDGFITQQPGHIHFGLAGAERIDVLEVAWPSGATGRWEGLPVDRLIRVREGDREARAEAIPCWPADSRPLAAKRFDLSVAMQPMDGGERSPLAKPGRPAVVHFWSPTCASCREELQDLARVSVASGSDVQFTAVLVNASEEKEARELLASTGVKWTNMIADPASLDSFFGRDGHATLPTTLVFDGEGRMRRMFARPVKEADLQPLLDSLRKEELFSADLVVVGNELLQNQDYEGALTALRRAASFRSASADVHHLLGLALVGLHRETEAVVEFRLAVDLDPGFAQALVNYGTALASTGRAAEATEAFERALRIQGERASTLLSLGNAAATAQLFPTALSAFDRAIRADEKSPDGWVGKGKVMILLKNLGEARKCLKRALELDPSHGEAKGLYAQLGDR